MCLLTGCEMSRFIYPDSKEFARICDEAREKGWIGQWLYDEKLQPDSDGDFFYLYRLRDKNYDKKDYIFGEDRTESNVYRAIIHADKEQINKMKEYVKELKGKKEEIITKIYSPEYTEKINRKTLIKDLETELFLLENYYGEVIEQRIDKTSLITKKEFLIRNKKTKAIAFKTISCNLYADREMAISRRKDPAKVEYKPKPGYDSSIKYEQHAVGSCYKSSVLLGQ
ncbi:hypothetical protein [Helicobacter bilis]